MRYENQEFVERTLPLDGHEYIRCRFVRCTLEYGAVADFVLRGCSFDVPRFMLVGAASDTVNTLRNMHSGGFAVQVEQLLESIKQTPPPDASPN